MSLVGRLRRGLALDDPKAWDSGTWRLRGYQSISGETVDEETCLGLSAVYNAVTLIAGTIGALPLHLLQTKNDRKRLADGRRLYRIMHDAWNPYQIAMSGRECLMAAVLLWGNGFCEIQRDGYGEVVALWPIPPSRVRIEIEDGIPTYYVRVESVDILFPRSRILHIPGMGFDGYRGVSVVTMARKSLGHSMALETFGSLFFGQGTHPGLILKHPGLLSPEAHKNLKEQGPLTSAEALWRSHRTVILEEGMSVERIGVSPEDSQFLESRQFQIPEVARWFNLPPHKLKDLTKSSFNNIESEQRSFYVDSILPWLVRLEQNYNLQLLTDGDRGMYGGGRLYFKHVAEGILRGDTAARGDFYQKMFNIGAFSPNDIRALEDLDPVPGGDIYLVPMNMTTLQNAGKLPEPKPEPTEEEEPEEALVSAGGNGNGQPEED